jgi:ABC-type glycerol-3-phosphate transport system permease component
MMAGALILQVPVLIIFALLSRCIVPNSLAGSVKG